MDNNVLAQKRISIEEYKEIYKVGFLIRVIAFLIDFLIISIPAVMIQYIIIASEIESPFFLFISIILIFLLRYVYAVYSTYKWQKTIGKAILGIEVIGESWNVTLKESLLRHLSLLAFFGIYFYLIFVIDNLWMLWDKGKLTLHDKLVGTRVVFSNHGESKWYIRIEERHKMIFVISLVCGLFGVYFSMNFLDILTHDPFGISGLLLISFVPKIILIGIPAIICVYFNYRLFRSNYSKQIKTIALLTLVINIPFSLIGAIALVSMLVSSFGSVLLYFL